MYASTRAAAGQGELQGLGGGGDMRLTEYGRAEEARGWEGASV